MDSDVGAAAPQRQTSILCQQTESDSVLLQKYHQQISSTLVHHSPLQKSLPPSNFIQPLKLKNKDILSHPAVFFPFTLQLPLAFYLFILSMRNNQHMTPNKKDNELFHSRYFSRSQRKSSNPQVYRSFFRQKPFERFYQDISALKPVSYQCPNASLLKRSYVVIDEKVSYGKPISAAQWQRLRTQKRTEPEVVTWGRNDKDLNLKIMSAPREIVPIQREKTVSRSGFWCCAPTIQEGKNVLVREL